MITNNHFLSTVINRIVHWSPCQIKSLKPPYQISFDLGEIVTEIVPFHCRHWIWYRVLL